MRTSGRSSLPPCRWACGAPGGASVCLPESKDEQRREEKGKNTQRSMFSVRRSHPRRGATLLVTLGILTVLSVMAVTFLVTSRLQRQTTASQQYRLAARNHIGEGLHLAMKMVEESLTYPNYTGKDIEVPDKAYLTKQRLAPVGHWFGEDYAKNAELSEAIVFQATDILASPAGSNGPTVNLLSPKALSLIPSALTNGLQLSSKKTPVFRSGWQSLDLLLGDSIASQLHSPHVRVAFTVFNCSGFIDANYFVGGPSTQKLPRVCFSQADVTNWLTAARAKYKTDSFEPIEKVLDLNDPKESPFSSLSYDPGPDLYPLHYDCFETCPTLGHYAFDTYPAVDLNLPQAYRVLSALKEKATYRKFNINSLTNHFALGTLSTDTASPWFNDARFKVEWLDPITELTGMMTREEPSTTLHRLPGGVALPWSVANFMDGDSIPQISAFTASADGGQELATRVNYAVEDVPLINKITVFNIFGGKNGSTDPEPPEGHDHVYYDVDSSLSNHYAVAVELWYPFVPHLPRKDTACYVGIYTNGNDVVTTTNKPWSQDLLRDWLRWNYSETSNTVMQTLFNAWGTRYLNAVGPSIWAHPLWQTVTADSDLWFTTSMTNHPYWPEADTNGTYDITATPIWQAFYPETYEEVETNGYGVFSTNIYTTLVVTNTVADWIEPPGNTTNRMIIAFEGQTAADYPWILWHNTGGNTYSTNRMTGFELADGTASTLSETNLLTAFYFMGDALWVVVTNTTDGTTVENAVSTLYLLDDTTNTLAVSTTNFVFYEESDRVQPLPMPGDLGTVLDSLMAMLPTNSVSSLYDFLMITPEDSESEALNGLLGKLSKIPGILDNLFPSMSEPSLGNMDEEDRFVLESDTDNVSKYDNGDVIPRRKLDTESFEGYFWTVYPKQVISFMSVDPIDGPLDKDGHQPVATNYHALGTSLNGKINTIWIRPVTTLRTDAPPTEDGGGAEKQDTIVDEALLTPAGETASIPVFGWTAVTNMYCPDPRQNAYIGYWRPFPAGSAWAEPVIRSTNLTAVSELPFIHFNAPFSSIGDIGHIYASYNRHTQTDPKVYPDGTRLYDTITFTTRSGAALTDIFTIRPANAPTRGLVQANTQQRPVIKALLSDVSVGWTNSPLIGIEAKKLLRDLDSGLENWADVYTDALTNAPYSMGWRSYADMLPGIATNETLRTENVWGGGGENLHPMHDYTEDVLRGIVDKVSFRQNIFVVIVAAQALSPASTPSRPVVLADQRAAVTVIRDAYTGRWAIHSWTWLTE